MSVVFSRAVLLGKNRGVGVDDFDLAETVKNLSERDRSDTQLCLSEVSVDALWMCARHKEAATRGIAA